MKRNKKEDEKLRLKAEQMQTKSFKELIEKLKKVNLTFGLSDEELADMMGDVIVGRDNPNLHKKTQIHLEGIEALEESYPYIAKLRQTFASRTTEDIDNYFKK